jgi:hypothetical protein
MSKIFISHTQKDVVFCDEFDDIANSVGIKPFRSELENIPTPAWETIKDEIKNNSVALFF